MVRLRGQLYLRDQTAHLFQFQYGTIKRSWASSQPAKHLYFNSSMVRLRVKSKLALESAYSNFNSSMVRLRGEREDTELEISITFQFQYGTIKSLEGVLFGGSANKFQFQYGTIKSQILLPYLVLCFPFQFQYGTIKSMAKWIF